MSLVTVSAESEFNPLSRVRSSDVMGILIARKHLIRDWSLIMGRGGYKTRGGGAREVLPLRKGGGGGKSFSHSEGGAQKVLG